MSIFELARNEARVFKFGSGTGTNFSRLRGRMEKLSGGGTSSGLMSFLEVLDAAQAPPSRRHHAARRQDGRARHGSSRNRGFHPLEGARGEEGRGPRRRRLPIGLQRRGLRHRLGPELEQLGARPRHLHAGGAQRRHWQTRFRTTGQAYETLRAKELWREIAESAWQCADPGVQFDDTIPALAHLQGDRSDQCDESMLRVRLPRRHVVQPGVHQPHEVHASGRGFDIEGYRHANRVFFLAQEILVTLASYPTEKIARRSHEFRPLGLGYANLGTLLMMQGCPMTATRRAPTRAASRRS
jgi:ribonucleoside-diphosphate reductase alpha chain